MLNTLLFSEEFPEVFSSAGDDVYRDMGKYLKIKDLDIYADKPELLESFCKDANSSMQRGFSLDKVQKDPEAVIDKEMIKSYAKELRRLTGQNEVIKHQLQRDIATLYKNKEYHSLVVIRDADIELPPEILQAIGTYEKKRKQEEALAIVKAKAKEAAGTEEALKNAKPAATVALPKTPEKRQSTQEVILKEQPKKVSTPAVEVQSMPEQVMLAETTGHEDEKALFEEPPVTVETKKVLTKLAYYEENIMRLKEELYMLRESEEHEKMACLNDITAINYWMIKLLKDENDACMVRDAIKQMKSYDKSAVNSCGRDSIRYIEWHGRIKPYVGTTLFKAEADCHR